MRGAEFAEMSAFAAIAEQRSFAKAAAQLGLGKSTLSQNLRSLEERLGVRLLNRTTRSVSLTEAGARLLARVAPSLVELKAAVDEVADHRQSPTGLLRLVVQPPVATLLIEPILARFLGEYPGVEMDVAVVKMPAEPSLVRTVAVQDDIHHAADIGNTIAPRTVPRSATSETAHSYRCTKP